jgi:hypothetical protein
VWICGELLVPLIEASCLHYWSHKTLAFGFAKGEREGGREEVYRDKSVQRQERAQE